MSRTRSMSSRLRYRKSEYPALNELRKLQLLPDIRGPYT